MLSSGIRGLRLFGNHGLTAVSRSLSVSSFLCGVQEDFEAAKNRLNTLKEEPDSGVKLQIYSLFKQSTEGKCNKPKPGMMDFVGKAKWDAWNSLGDMSKEDAMKAYIGIVQDLAAQEGPSEPESSDDDQPQYTGIKVTKAEGVCTILLNRPSKKNAITTVMYDEWRTAMGDAANDPKIRLAVVTGAGDYFCSGNDLGNFMIPPDQMVSLAEEFKELLHRFVAQFIDFPKPLIAAVNGPAVGISVTTLGLYDAVFAADHATFNTPFSNLGQTPEGCSSVLFPAIMGPARASSMLMFNKKITAQEANELGLVTQVIPQSSFELEMKKIISEYAQLPPETMVYAKELIRSVQKEQLHRANRVECERLKERWLSEECKKAIINFFQRKR